MLFKEQITGEINEITYYSISTLSGFPYFYGPEALCPYKWLVKRKRVKAFFLERLMVEDRSNLITILCV